MLEALVGGERDPHALAGPARGRMRTKHAELLEALTGAFDDHHGELARIMLDHIDGLTRRIDQLTTRIDELIAAIPAAGIPDHDGDDTGDRHYRQYRDWPRSPGPANPALQPSWPKWAWT